MARSFEQIYAEAPASAVGRLTAFRDRYESRFIEHNGCMYRVWDVNEAETGRVFLFFPSGIGHGEIWFPYMLTLRRHARCIAFSYAEDTSVKSYCESVNAVLEELGVDADTKISLIGVSVGGLVAQSYASLNKDRVERMVLALTGTSAQKLDPGIRAEWIKRKKMKFRMKLQNYGPGDKLHMAGRMFSSICPEKYQDSQTFWCAYLEDSYDQYVYKAQHIAINTGLVPDIYDSARFTPESFDGSMKTLILESSGDNTYTEPERAMLRALFPNATVEDIGPNGQFSMQLMEERCQEILESFLAG